MECRKSERVRKLTRAFSPELKPKQPKVVDEKRIFGDKLPSGEPFMCEMCHSRKIYDPLTTKWSVRRPVGKSGKYRQLPRQILDKETGKFMIVCHSCGLSHNRKTSKSGISKNSYSKEQLEHAKETYLNEAKIFTESLYQETGNSDCHQLFCPHMITVNGCGCLQNSIKIGCPQKISLRVHNLLNFVRKARDLRKTASQRRGLGFGRKKTDEYASFVMENRKYLRDELDLCEKACQKILLYSNNFLHKKLVTEQSSSRLEKTQQQSGVLVDIEKIPQQKCCGGNCTRMAITHPELLREWRDGVQKSQHDARIVLAQMLTPAGGSQFNCYKFITMVTGCSSSTISRVSSRMLKTGGKRQPPEHGLKKYWRNKKSKNTDTEIKEKGTEPVCNPEQKSVVTSVPEASQNQPINQVSLPMPSVIYVGLTQDAFARPFFLLHQSGQPLSLVSIPSNVVTTTTESTTSDVFRNLHAASPVNTAFLASLPTNVQTVLNSSTATVSNHAHDGKSTCNLAATRTTRSSSLPSNITLDCPRQPTTHSNPISRRQQSQKQH